MKFRILLEATVVEDYLKRFLEMPHDTPEAKEDFVEGGRNLISSIVGMHNALFDFIDKADDQAISLLSSLQAAGARLGSSKFSDIVKLLAKIQIQKIKHEDSFKNIIALGDLYQKNIVDLSEKFLTNPSLYSRSSYDFSYAVQILKIAHDPEKLKKTYGDNPNIKVEDLYKGDEVKESGAITKPKNDLNTIYGTVEMWKRLASGKSSSSDANKEYPTFNNFEKAEESKSPIVNIKGTFKYNKDSKKDFKWEPIS